MSDFARNDLASEDMSGYPDVMHDASSQPTLATCGFEGQCSALARAQALARLSISLANVQVGCEAILELCAREMQGLMADASVLMLREPGTDLLRLGAMAADGQDRRDVLELLLNARPGRVGEGFSGRCIADARTFVANHLSAEVFRSVVPADHFAHMALRMPQAIISVPLMSRGYCFGALTLIRHQNPVFTAEDIEFAEAMAAPAAVAIANARLVDELREANRDLIGTRDELRQTVDDLESFISSVSHDLRGPVRAVDALTQIALEDSVPPVSPETANLMERVRANAKRMAELIDDLLRLARIGRRELNADHVDLSRLAANVVKLVGERYPGRAVEVSIAAGMTAWGDPGLLRIVLENLVDNAFKFTGRRTDAAIEITAPEGATFAIRDNGAGFDSAHQARLFQPFHRLHTAQEFPGHGVGLATVRRIINRHGGTIVGVSEPSHGALFCVSLPAPPTPARSP